MKLERYEQGDYEPGAPLSKQLLWWFFGAPLVRSSFVPFSGLRVLTLRAFGATIGKGVRIKPGVRVKFPWRLKVGDFTWIGEDVWIDNLACVEIGRDCCLSQGVYLCTGNHDWKKDSFDLRTSPIVLGNEVWLGAMTRIGPGVRIGDRAVTVLGTVCVKDLEGGGVYGGNSAEWVRGR